MIRNWRWRLTRRVRSERPPRAQRFFPLEAATVSQWTMTGSSATSAQCWSKLSRGEEVRAMAGLCRVFVDRAATRDTLARRQFGMVFDGTDQQIKRVLRMRLDKFELPESEREGFDVIAVLHLVEAV